jgi:thiamine biosynthesis lipoprotein
MREYAINQKLMGTAFTLGLLAEKEAQANLWLEMGLNEIKRIENLLSEFLPDSETTKINQNAGLSRLKIDRECFELIIRCCSLSKLTKGDFDITVNPLKKLYQFKNTQFEMPEGNIIGQILQCIGYQNISLNDSDCTIGFKNPQTKISFAAIGKGYASDRVKKLWLANGVKSGYINASGDLNTFGQKVDKTAWKVGIANPDNKNKMLLFVTLPNSSVATSGDYEQYFIFRNRRYSHNINPHTGMPLSGIKSVTVFSPGAELSDALATAIYVKGVTRGITFANQLPHTHCIIIDDKNKIFFSNRLNYETVGS